MSRSPGGWSGTIYMDDFDARFGGVARLYGRTGLKKLQTAHVAVIGVGGVGVWTAEALARSGVGAITLVDMDEVCATNINRQLHALTHTVGQPKVQVMAERLLQINPQCQVTALPVFFHSENADSIFTSKFNYVFDAVDSFKDKVALLHACQSRSIRVVSAGAAGGRRAADQVRMADLSMVTHDRLLAGVRRELRRLDNLDGDRKPMGIDCVYSPEPPVYAQPDGSVGPVRPEAEPGTRLDCNVGLGSAAFVTGAFGFVAASWIVGRIAA